MSPFSLRMLAYDRRDMALFYVNEAKSYRREGSIGMCRSRAQKALREWRKYKQLLRDAREAAQ